MTSNDSLVEAPLVVADASAVDWLGSADVVVIGFGCAGAVAAIEAREQGAEVLIVDRFEGGGATAYSGGVYYAGNTRHQREAGFQDSVEDMFQYLAMEVGDAVRPETLRRFCEQSAGNIEWLEQHGVPFGSKLFIGKTTYPQGDSYLYFSGNEKIERYKKNAKPAPRGHRTFGKGWTGRVFFASLAAATARLGIARKTHSRAIRFVLDTQDRVIGVEVAAIPFREQRRHQALYKEIDPMKPFGFRKAVDAICASRELETSKGERQFIRARKGVILATGGFGYNLEMLRQHLPKYAENAPSLLRLGSMGCDGSGMHLAESAGAQLGKMHRLFAGRSISPPFEQVMGLIVNDQGRRFINEDAYNATLGEAIADQSGSKAWLILDGRLFWKVIRKLIPRGDGYFMTWYLPSLLNILLGGTRRAASIPELARKCGIDAAGLEQEMESYNTAARARATDSQGKLPEYFAPVEGNSYYAVNMSMANKYSFMLFFTLGGVRVNEGSGAALRADGSAIEGLYAAGRAAVGLCGNTYGCSGISLADGVFSGRRAGRHCANLEGAKA